MKLERELDTIERAEWYLLARIEKIERRILEIENGGLSAIVPKDSQDDIIDSYEKELRMYKFLKTLIEN